MEGMDDKLKTAQEKEEEDKNYFQFPLHLLRDLFKDKHKCLNNIISYGVYAFANTYSINKDSMFKHTIYKYFRRKDELPSSIVERLKEYEVHGLLSDHTDISQLFDTKGNFDAETQIQEFYEIFEDDLDFFDELADWYKSVMVYKKFGITGDYLYTYSQGKKIAETILPKEPIPMMNKKKLFEYRDNEKSDHELLKFAVILAMNSILGKSSVRFTNKDMIFSRAFGYKDIKQLKADNHNIRQDHYEMYFDKKRPGKVIYHTNKILDEIEIENWNLYKYSNNSMRGIYIAKKRSIKLEKVIEMAKERNRKYRIKAIKVYKREIEKRVFGKKNKQQPDTNVHQDDTTT